MADCNLSVHSSITHVFDVCNLERCGNHPQFRLSFSTGCNVSFLVSRQNGNEIEQVTRPTCVPLSEQLQKRGKAEVGDATIAHMVA
jgi:hypothetical protein